MDFCIADTFTGSLGRLTAQEQKAVKTTAFDMQLDPSAPGLSYHQLDRAADKSFWSMRVNADIRIIVHRTSDSLLLAYVGHHDDAYKWAERRKIERHPTTGAMQMVEVQEIAAEEIHVPPPIRPEEPVPPPVVPEPIFDNLRKFELMAFGVPAEWVDAVRDATEDTLLDVLTHLPQEAGEALLRLAVGEKPEPPEPAPPEADPLLHPDARRRFRVVAGAEELRLALDYPWEKWTVFLHPAQRDLVERSFSGPARVSGSAGTGKTIVALHRAVHLARTNPNAPILLSTFSRPLANMLRGKLRLLVNAEPDTMAQITVKALPAIGYDLHTELFGQPEIASAALVRSLLKKASTEISDHGFSHNMLFGEWSEVVDAWQLKAWEDYRDVARLGRKTRIGGRQREVLWSIFSRVRDGLAERKVITWAQVFGRLTDHLLVGNARPFQFAVIDEAQDIGVAEARFLAAVAGSKPDGLFFAGDLGQRIFQQPFSWLALGLDIRGRSSSLKVNYRTSHQIRQQADRLLSNSISDVDGVTETRRGTVSLFEGPAPEIRICSDPVEESGVVVDWIAARLADGVNPDEIAVFVRSNAELERARLALRSTDVACTVLDDKIEIVPGSISISTMHLAKGLEFRAVAIMACDDEIVPLQSRIEAVADDADLEEIYTTERHLLYVACTRARDHLLITGIEPASEFLMDMRKS